MARLWKRFQAEKAAGTLNPTMSCRRTGRKARDLTPFMKALHDIPLKLRMSQRGIAAALGLPTTTLTRYMKNHGIKPHTRFLKPLLSNTSKKQRLEWALSWITTTGMETVVHVDEKWFYGCKDDDEQKKHHPNPPSRKLQHKRSQIAKVMFLGVGSAAAAQHLQQIGFQREDRNIPLHGANDCPARRNAQQCCRDGGDQDSGDNQGALQEDADRPRDPRYQEPVVPPPCRCQP
ncbi:unnamed protein product [Pylaiella littoralis]